MAGAAVEKTLQVYKFARDTTTTLQLPRPLVPVRDHVLIPSFRGVERAVEFLLSERLGEAYVRAKAAGASLPVLGPAVVRPSLDAAEGAARFLLVIVQAPLPSAERVSHAVEVSMERGKRGLVLAAREVYFYVDLVDVQLTRTVTRAQWDFLGYGPYVGLPPERRREVRDRTCERYFDFDHPLRRYEFLAHIRGHDTTLYQDLVATGLLWGRAQRAGFGGGGGAAGGSAVRGVSGGGSDFDLEEGGGGGSSVGGGGGMDVSADAIGGFGSGGGDVAGGIEESQPRGPFAADEWLRRDAPWRRGKWHYQHGLVLDDLGDHFGPCAAAWFWRREADANTRGPWMPFPFRECRRLERAYRRFAAENLEGSPQWPAEGSAAVGGGVVGGVVEGAGDDGDGGGTAGGGGGAVAAGAGKAGAGAKAGGSILPPAEKGAAAGGSGGGCRSGGIIWAGSGVGVVRSGSAGSAHSAGSAGGSECLSPCSRGYEAEDLSMEDVAVAATSPRPESPRRPGGQQAPHFPKPPALLDGSGSGGGGIGGGGSNSGSGGGVAAAVAGAAGLAAVGGAVDPGAFGDRSWGPVAADRRAAAAAPAASGRSTITGGVGQRTFTYKTFQDAYADVRLHEVSAEHDIFVDQGRRVVSLDVMRRRPVYWPFSGDGDFVRRAVWLQETGTHAYVRPDGSVDRHKAAVAAAGQPLGLKPYPAAAAALLEDAYQFLKWYLGAGVARTGAGQGGRSGSRGSGLGRRSGSGGSAESATAAAAGAATAAAAVVPGAVLEAVAKVAPPLAAAAASAAPGRSRSPPPSVLLTVQVMDELVQFRGLTDIMSVKRTLGGAMSVLGRKRVYRGVPPLPAEQEAAAAAAAAAAASTTAVAAPVVPAPLPPAEAAADAADATAMRASTCAEGGKEAAAAAPGAAPAVESPPVLGRKGAAAAKTQAEADGGGAQAVSGGAAAEQEEGGGYGSGDDDDEDLKEHVDHLLLVVHGIGDALNTMDLGVVQLKSLIECCDNLRAQHEEVVRSSPHLRQLWEEGGGGGAAGGGSTGGAAGGGGTIGGGGVGARGKGRGRVEVLPLEWHSRFKSRLHEQGRGGRADAAAGGGGGRVSGDGESGGGGGNGREGGNGGEGGKEDGGSGDGGGGGDTAAEGAAAADTDAAALGAGPASAGGPHACAAVTNAGTAPTVAFSGPSPSPGPGGGAGRRTDAAPSSVDDAAAASGAAALSIWDITLRRAPTLRAYTNDTVLDILYFLSPPYHQQIIEEVSNEINRVVDLFRRHTPSWSGRVSIAAHSLGAIICFDILANQRWPGAGNGAGGGASGDAGAAPDAAVAGATSGGAAAALAAASAAGDSWSYYQGSTRFVPLHAPVENLFCLGSPIGMFLMIRGQHRPLGKSFRLPGCRRLYNVFHPYDPVAFRLEPLVCGPEATVREPEILPTWQGGLRVHYQVKRWWQGLLGTVWRLKRRVESGLEASLESLGLIDEEGAVAAAGDATASAAAASAVAAVGAASAVATIDGRSHEARLEAAEDGVEGEVAGSVAWMTGAAATAARTTPAAPGKPVSVTEAESGGGPDVSPVAAGKSSGGSGDAGGGGGGDGIAAGEEAADDDDCADAGERWEDDDESEEEDVESNGLLAGGRRIDYSLQEKEIEVTNEYIFALGAHVIYWTTKDLSLFMAKQIMLHGGDPNANGGMSGGIGVGGGGGVGEDKSGGVGIGAGEEGVRISSGSTSTALHGGGGGDAGGSTCGDGGHTARPHDDAAEGGATDSGAASSIGAEPVSSAGVEPGQGSHVDAARAGDCAGAIVTEQASGGIAEEDTAAMAAIADDGRDGGCGDGDGDNDGPRSAGSFGGGGSGSAGGGLAAAASVDEVSSSAAAASLPTSDTGEEAPAAPAATAAAAAAAATNAIASPTASTGAPAAAAPAGKMPPEHGKDETGFPGIQWV